MIWLLANIRMVGLALLIASIPIAYLVGTHKGKTSCEVRHEIKQLEHTVEVKKKHADIDKKTPYAADRAAKFKWLRDNASK